MPHPANTNKSSNSASMSQGISSRSEQSAVTIQNRQSLARTQVQKADPPFWTRLGRFRFGHFRLVVSALS